MRRIITPALSLVACFVLFACNSSNVSTPTFSSAAVPSPVIGANNVAAADLGDTQGIPTHWDIGRLQAQRIGPPGGAYTEIVVSLSFEKQTPMDGVPDNTAFGSLPAPSTICALATTLCGQIEIDTDNNVATGTNITYCGANGSYPGTDFTVDIGTLNKLTATGQANVYSNAAGFLANQVGVATITGGGNVVNVFIPISIIGGSANGPFNVGAVVGNGAGPTDCAANAGFIPDGLGIQSGAPWTSWTHQ